MSIEDMMTEILAKLENLEKRMTAIEGSSTKASHVEGKKLSMKEYLLTKKPTDDVQRTLAIGYYLEHFEGMRAFNVKDITEGFRSAKEPTPANINDKVNLNIRKGHMMAEKEKKDKLTAWVLTNSGEKYIEEGLPEDG